MSIFIKRARFTAKGPRFHPPLRNAEGSGGTPGASPGGSPEIQTAGREDTLVRGGGAASRQGRVGAVSAGSVAAVPDVELLGRTEHRN